jgi:alpha-amylase
VAALVAQALVACGESSTTPPFGGLPTPERPALAPTYRPSGHAAAGDVFVHLFEWKWTDIATECEQVLGPAGYHAVQVSPPQEHSLTPSRDWSQRYQPVSYSLARSRSGTEEEFVAMVDRCGAAGVGIYVDAVVNHMTNFPSPGVGSAGTAYAKYSYPGLYELQDFHSACVVDDYTSAANVQDCELLSLPDLDTGSPDVQRKIASYLVDLARLGVAGFRIDAAKHIQQVELDDILAIVDSTLTADGRPIPYWFLEVIAGAGEALSPRHYYGAAYRSGGAADITEFVFAGVADKFLGRGGQYLAQLDPDGPPGSRFSESAWGLMPADKAVVFLENHDTQHHDGVIGYRDAQVFRLATVWMLAQPYGYPKILSSYAFDRPAQNAMGPPSDASGATNDVACAPSLEDARVGDWVCEHRDPRIAAMVAFRSVVAGTPIDNWWDDGANAIAFSRGDRGFIAINRGGDTLTARLTTGMAVGAYCDVLSGGASPSAAACVGTTVVVDEGGAAEVELPPDAALAIHAGSVLPGGQAPRRPPPYRASGRREASGSDRGPRLGALLGEGVGATPQPRADQPERRDPGVVAGVEVPPVVAKDEPGEVERGAERQEQCEQPDATAAPVGDAPERSEHEEVREPGRHADRSTRAVEGEYQRLDPGEEAVVHTPFLQSDPVARHREEERRHEEDPSGRDQPAPAPPAHLGELLRDGAGRAQRLAGVPERPLGRERRIQVQLHLVRGAQVVLQLVEIPPGEGAFLREGASPVPYRPLQVEHDYPHVWLSAAWTASQPSRSAESCRRPFSLRW